MPYNGETISVTTEIAKKNLDEDRPRLSFRVEYGRRTVLPTQITVP